MLNRTLVSACLGLSFWLSSPVTAQPDILQVVKASHQGQLNQMKPIAIALAPGQGVTLNFRLANQVVSQAWLDNPAFVTLNGNGCLGVIQKECHRPTNVIHLKRISDLTIPGLPQTDSTYLTVVTEGSNGGGIYLFHLYKADQAQKVIYEIRPVQPFPSQTVVNPGESTHAQ